MHRAPPQHAARPSSPSQHAPPQHVAPPPPPLQHPPQRSCSLAATRCPLRVRKLVHLQPPAPHQPHRMHHTSPAHSAVSLERARYPVQESPRVAASLPSRRRGFDNHWRTRAGRVDERVGGHARARSSVSEVVRRRRGGGSFVCEGQMLRRPGTGSPHPQARQHSVCSRANAFISASKCPVCTVTKHL